MVDETGWFREEFGREFMPLKPDPACRAKSLVSVIRLHDRLRRRGSEWARGLTNLWEGSWSEARAGCFESQTRRFEPPSWEAIEGRAAWLLNRCEHARVAALAQNLCNQEGALRPCSP